MGNRDSGASSGTYDPFALGPLGVDICELRIRDSRRRREFRCTTWQSSAAPSATPVVLYSHGTSGGRRSANYLCTHLASHGYSVAALDHSETIARSAESDEDGPAPASTTAGRVIDDRVPDMRLLLDSLPLMLDSTPIRGSAEFAVGLVGHSLGGWTVLRTADVDTRIGAVVALVPAGSATPRPGVIHAPLTPERAVPTLFVAAEMDVPIPPSDVQDVFARTPGATALVNIHRADHYHFVENATDLHEQARRSTLPGAAAWMPATMRPISELADPAVIHSAIRALTLAHFDATLRANPHAQDFLNNDVVAACAKRRVDVDVDIPACLRDSPGQHRTREK